MKTFISSVVLFSVFASSAAIADQRAFVNRAALTRPQSRVAMSSKLLTFNMDRRENLNVAGGSVLVDTQGREITLSLIIPPPACLPGQFCSHIVFAPRVISLPLVNMQQNSCGTITYTATQDLRTVDGALQTIEVRDNTRNRCPTLIAMAATDVILSDVPARASFNEERVSTFTGTALVNTLLSTPLASQPAFGRQ